MLKTALYFLVASIAQEFQLVVVNLLVRVGESEAQIRLDNVVEKPALVDILCLNVV